MYAYEMHNNVMPTCVDPLLATKVSKMNLLWRGKDKDIFDLGDMLLMVSTDRLSVAGKSIEQGFSGKGKLVNQISAYWFRKLRDVSPNHFVTADPACFPEAIRSDVENLDGRSMLVWKTTPLPIRFVVRGYLAGSGWREYQETGEICGTKLPQGLVESQRLPSPLFAPTVKGRPGGLNENVDFESLKLLLGRTLADHLRETSLRLYFNAWKIARERGVLIADTKFEFGLLDGKLMLIDECLTPDTSRFWSLDSYRYGGPMLSMDKHLLLDCLDSQGDCDGTIQMPEELLCRVKKKYIEVCKRIIGNRDFAKMELSGTERFET